MNRWNNKERVYVDSPDVDLFLKDIVQVFKNHNKSISHEDIHGSFVIEEYSESNERWLLGASVNIKEG